MAVTPIPGGVALQTLSPYVVQLLNGLAFSMLLFLLAAGLSVIFGMMDSFTVRKRRVRSPG